MKPLEILAPAGNREKLEAAVSAGADAVYLAGQAFGARSYADNFTTEEMQKALDYCHLRNVNVYVTVNTLIKPSEVNAVIKYIETLYTIGVDAVIVQDIWLLQRIKEHLPSLEVHVSTQMTAHSPADVAFLEACGADRVILSREVSVDEIKAIQEQTSLPLEIFVHGALCVSYSGQCLMSSMIGGRSGNRGKCAQPCRQLYELYRKKDDQKIDEGYLLSPKDLKTIQSIETLQALGVASLKIEGRMKSPEYVYTTVKAYKTGNPNAPLEKVFNRGFTKGFLMGATAPTFGAKDSPSHHGNRLGTILSKTENTIEVLLEEAIELQDEIQVRHNHQTEGTRIEAILKNNHQVQSASAGDTVQLNFDKPCTVGQTLFKTYDVAFRRALAVEMNNQATKVPLELEAHLHIGKTPVITLTDAHGASVTVTIDFTLEQARNKPVESKQIKEQLMKMGNTPYEVIRCEIRMDDSLFIPISRLNKLRREAVKELNAKRLEMKNKTEKKMPRISRPLVSPAAPDAAFEVAVETLEQLQTVQDEGFQRVFYKDLKTLKKAKEIMPEVIPSLPRISSNAFYKNYGPWLRSFDRLEVNNMGQVGYFENHQLIGGFPLNIMNAQSLKFYHEKGLEALMLSPELDLSELGTIFQSYPMPISIMVYGYLPVMVTKYNFLPDDDIYYLKNKFNDQFFLQEVAERNVEIYHSKKLMMLDRLDELKRTKATYYRLNFTIESAKEVKRVLQSLKAETTPLTYDSTQMTRGHFYEGVK